MLRILTYNVHACVGTDRVCDASRIADVIRACSPDVAVLQELHSSHGSPPHDQPAYLAAALQMQVVFSTSWPTRGGGHFGHALLSPWPVTLQRMGHLPSCGYEPRTALAVLVEVAQQTIQVVGTHLSLWQRERLVQTEALLDEWIMDPTHLTVVAGDFNATPGSPTYRRFCRSLVDVTAPHVPKFPRGGTWPSWGRPRLRLDHIFARGLTAQTTQIVNTPLTRKASDHLPLLAELP